MGRPLLESPKMPKPPRLKPRRPPEGPPPPFLRLPASLWSLTHGEAVVVEGEAAKRKRRSRSKS